MKTWLLKQWCLLFHGKYHTEVIEVDLKVPSITTTIQCSRCNKSYTDIIKM